MHGPCGGCWRRRRGSHRRPTGDRPCTRACASHVTVPASLVVAAAGGDVGSSGGGTAGGIRGGRSLRSTVSRGCSAESGSSFMVPRARWVFAALEWARHVGARVFGNSRHQRQTGLSRIARHRARERFAVRRFVSEVLEWTDGEGVDVVLNPSSDDADFEGISRQTEYCPAEVQRAASWRLARRIAAAWRIRSAPSSATDRFCEWTCPGC